MVHRRIERSNRLLSGTRIGQPCRKLIRHRLWRERLLQQLGHWRRHAGLLRDHIREADVPHALDHAPREPGQKRRNGIDEHGGTARERRFKSGRAARHSRAVGLPQDISRLSSDYLDVA